MSIFSFWFWWATVLLPPRKYATELVIRHVIIINKFYSVYLQILLLLLLLSYWTLGFAGGVLERPSPPKQFIVNFHNGHRVRIIWT